MQHMDGDYSALRYVRASSLTGPAGHFSDVELRGRDDERLGEFAGVLINPAEGRVRFYVVEADGWLQTRRYLIPADLGARVDADGRSLHMDMDREALKDCETFEGSSVRHYSDDDLLSGMFGVHTPDGAHVAAASGEAFERHI